MISTSGMRRATSATRSVPLAACGIGHFRPAAKGLHGLVNVFVIGRHADSGRPPGPPGRFVGMLNQRLAGLGQEQLPRQPRRSQPGGDDDLTAHESTALITRSSKLAAIRFPGGTTR